MNCETSATSVISDLLVPHYLLMKFDQSFIASLWRKSNDAQSNSELGNESCVAAR